MADPPALTRLTQEHLNRYLETLPPEGRSNPRRYAAEFVARYGFATRESVDRYLADLRSRPSKDGTVLYAFGVLRRLFRVNNLSWPYRPRETPLVRDADRFAPILASEVIRDMIYAACKPGFPRHIQVHLALATTYGLRREELAQNGAADVRLNDGVIYVHTVKKGRERYHLIPEQLQPVFERCLPLMHPRGLRALVREFRRLERMIGLPHTRGVGWHSIRRSLDRELLNAGLPEYVVASFLRWRKSDSMPFRYASGTVIGRQGSSVSLALPDKEIDLRVFEIHPFLPVWSKALSATAKK